jgi:hypothetical protein
MQLAPVNPPWSESEAVHKIQDAYLATIADGSFGRDAQLEEFGSIGTTAQPPADDAPRSYTIAELMRADLRLSWIVEPLLVDMQPLVIGGTEKTFKTGLTFDLLWSLATNTPWLGKFPACEHRSSIFFTAEIGMEATQDLARRVGEFKGIDPFGVHDMVVTSYLPMITRSKEGDTLKQFYSELDTRKPQIVAIDPLYLVSPDIETANPYLLSGILAKFSAICRERGIWLIVCHHSRQLNSGAVMSLQDLYGAGCGMFFRQWVLLSHATPYANGRADLNMAIGGSATGSRGQWRVEIDEGEAQELVASRHWRTTVTPAGDHAPDSLDQPMAEYLLSFYGDEPIDAAQLVKWTGFAKDDVATIQQGLAAAGLIRFAGTGFVRKNQQNAD